MTATYLAGQHPGSSFTSLTVSPVHDHRDALQARPFPCGLSSPIPMLSCDKLPPLLARSATCHSWPVCRRASPRCPTAFPLTLCHARRRGLGVSSLRCRTPCVHGRPACIGGQSMLTTRLPQHAGDRLTAPNAVVMWVGLRSTLMVLVMWLTAACARHGSLMLGGWPVCMLRCKVVPCAPGTAPALPSGVHTWTEELHPNAIFFLVCPMARTRILLQHSCQHLKRTYSRTERVL